MSSWARQALEELALSALHADLDQMHNELAEVRHELTALRQPRCG